VLIDRYQQETVARQGHDVRETAVSKRSTNRHARVRGVRRPLIAASVAFAALVGAGALAAPEVTSALLADTAASSATAASIGTYDQRVNAASPLGYWRMDEAAVTNGASLVDSSGRGNTGRYVAGDLLFTATSPNYAGGNVYQYRSVNVDSTYAIRAGDRFEYDIFLPTAASTETARLGVDLITTDGSTLRDGGYSDQNGRAAHPNESPSLPRGVWVHRIFTIGTGTPLAGKTAQNVYLVAEGDTGAVQSARLSNIRFTDSSGVMRKSFWAAGDPVPGTTPTNNVVPSNSTYSLGSGTASARTPGPLVIYGGGLGGVTFGGDANRAELPAGALDMAGATAFSVEAWVKGTEMRYIGSAFVARQERGEREQYVLDSYQDQARFFVRTAAGADIGTYGPSVNDGKWHHLVGVYNNGTVILYVDGVRASSVAGSAGSGLLAMPAGVRTTIGTRDGQPLLTLGYEDMNGLTGSVDEVAIYGRALSLSEIQDHYLHR
jgi:hypothetical protein